MKAKGLTDVEIIGMLRTYVKKSLIGQGALKGEDGFSPTVVVKTNTDSEYVLTITDANGSYDTPNLKGTGGGGDIDVTFFADEYSENVRYKKGEIVAYQGNLYQFNTNHMTKGPWDASQVDEIDFESLLTYNTAVKYGYRNNYEDNLFKTLLTSSGNTANNVLAEIIGEKIMVGPANNAAKWVNDSMAYDEVTNCLYWGGPDPNDPTVSSKAVVCKLDLSTWTITSSNLNLPNSGWTDNKGTVVRDIAFFGDYMYIAARSEDTPRPSASTDLLGALLCVRKSDLVVMWTQKMDARCCGVNVFKATNGTVYLMLNGRLEYFKLYTVNEEDPTDVTLVTTRYFNTYPSAIPIPQGSTKETTVDEQQKGLFYENVDGKVWYIGAGFGDGVHIWDVTDASNVTLIGNYRFKDHRDVIPNDTYHTLSCVLSYPYVYATLGPISTVARADFNNGTNNRRMGLLTLDISLLSDIKGTVQQIAVDDMCDFLESGDPKPIAIKRKDDKLFLANGNKGVAIYDISVPSRPVYLGTKFISEVNDVGGIEIVGNRLFVGDCGINKLYTVDLVYRTPKYIKAYSIYSGYKGMDADHDGYGALEDVGIIEDFADSVKYPSADCIDFTKMTSGTNAGKLQAAIDSGKTVLVPHGVYDLEGVAINFPLNRIVNIVGENTNACVFKNCNFKATGGLSLKNLTLDGGTKTSIEGLSWQPTVMIDATPKVDTATHIYINCVFKGNGTTQYASYASQEKDACPYNGINRFKIDKDIVDNCIFDGFMYCAINHCLRVDYASFTNNIFRNIGIVDDVPFDYVASPSGNPNSQSYAENTENVYELVENPTGNPKTQGWFEQTSEDVFEKTTDTSVNNEHTYYELKDPVGTYFPTKDSTVKSTKRYYKPKGRYIGALRLGDSTGNNVNEVKQCTIYKNVFENVFNNEYYWDVTHCDECNFVKIRARYITITHNKFKDLVGYGGDREGVYVKAYYADISYNYIENGGMGEGYICCKNISTIDYQYLEPVENPTGNPKTQVWFEPDIPTTLPLTFHRSDDTTVVEGKTYYAATGFKEVENPTGNPYANGWFVPDTPLTTPLTFHKTSDTSVKSNTTYYSATAINQMEWLKRYVHIHDNVLMGYGGRGIRTYYNATVENNTIYIRNAKSAIWCGGDKANTDALKPRFYTNSIIRNNKISIGFGNFYLTNPKTLELYAQAITMGLGVMPTDYHDRTEAISAINDGRLIINDNTIDVELSEELNATLNNWDKAYKAIAIQYTREFVDCSGNQIMTNGRKASTGVSAIKLAGIYAIWYDYESFALVNELKINICKNDIRDGYIPMHLLLVGLTQANTIVEVKDNTVWQPELVKGGRGNYGCELELYDKKSSYDNTNKSTSLVFTSTQKDAGFTNAYICTDCENVETEDVTWIQHINSLS